MELHLARHQLRRLAGIPTLTVLSDPAFIPAYYPDTVVAGAATPELLARQWIAQVRPLVDTGSPLDDLAQAAPSHPAALTLTEPKEVYLRALTQLLEHAPQLAAVTALPPLSPLLRRTDHLGAWLRAGYVPPRPRSPEPPTAPPDRAKSAAERLLYQALEAQTHTRGLFQLNQNLDIRFGPRPLEVDLFAAQAALAIEVDGYHHFHDEVRYRRDRRKDFLMQTQNLWVLRVLALDVHQNLAEVLALIDEALRLRGDRCRP